MKKRILAFLLCFALVMPILPVSAATTDDIGLSATSVTLPQYEKKTITATPAANVQVSAWQWQIKVPGTEVWVDISGANGSTLELSYAMVASLLSDNQARIRCEAVIGGETVETGEITVTMDYTTTPAVAAPSETVEPQVMTPATVVEGPTITAPGAAETQPAATEATADVGALEEARNAAIAAEDAAQAKVNEAQAAYDNAVKAEGEAKTALDQAQADYDAAVAAATPAETASTDPTAESTAPAAVTVDATALDAAKAAYANAQAATAAAKQTLDEATAALSTAQSNTTTAQAALDAATPAMTTFGLLRNANSGIALAAEEDTPALSEYTIVINYVFENNTVVADPYTATLAAGSNFSAIVKHPSVMGYLPYIDNATETSTQIELNVTNIQEDITYTVTYKPTNVDYTVIHYQQNVDNDNYTIAETETKQGLTGSTVPDVAKDYPGFYDLLYEKPEIAADGSTVVEVYYDRMYYLMTFELSGGYGVEPIYARFGSEIPDVGTPTRAGYSFDGWTLNSTEASIPGTMPAENRTYTARWKVDDTAKVTIVFWGENPNDEQYSYIKSAEVNVKPGTSFTYSEDGSLICGITDPHTHNDGCYACGQVAHTHDASCYTLNCTLGHSHSSNCYDNVGDAANPAFAPDNPVNGYIYAWDLGLLGSGKRIYIDGTWYVYNGNLGNGDIASANCGKTEHTHTDYTGSCYTLTCTTAVHEHSTDCGYKCGLTEHTHTSSCYMSDAGLDSSLWKFVESDTVTVDADGSTVVNVYYDRTEFTLTFKKNNSTVKTITEKWGADIHSEFPITDNNGTIQWQVPNGCESMEPGTRFASLVTMPAENITFTYYDSDDAVTLTYYVEALPGEEYVYTREGKNFKLYKEVDIQSGVYLTYTEEFHDITGFKQWWSDPAFDKHEQGGQTKTVYSGDECILCYTRNAFDIVFYNPTDLIKTQEDVPYQMALSSYYWEPTSAQAPEMYEPGSVQFDGWYLNPDCSGTEFDFTTNTMPAGPNNINGETALALYAKWVPVTHTVSFYLDKAAYEAGTKLDSHPDVTVPHGEKLETTPADPENGSYTFVGWFYMEDGVEKAFDFANMPVNKDLKVYGKWSSNVLKEYSVYFKIQGTDTQIADPITGSGLAGITKTFDAKGGTDLYADYQEGYFPLVASHSMTLDIENEENNTFTFWYVQKQAVPYTVYYVAETLKDGEDAANYQTITRDGKNYYIIADTYTNDQNRKAVVTEKFKQVSGYMPDAYQKRLVVDGTDGAVNEIIFFYSVDSTHAYYKITHYTQNTDGATWTEYASSQAVGEIGQTYSADPLTIDGFTYDSTVDGTMVSGELTANGLELKLYYVRNEYPYLVRYLEQGTGKQLADPKSGTGKYGQVISESAIDIDGYTAVDPTSQTLTIKIETDEVVKLNIITFYYEEAEVEIKYEVVGPDGCGTVTPESETLKVITGEASGSTATASSDVYKFVGWYSDPECKNLLTTDAKYVPTKEDDELWIDGTTYYAKFEYNLTDLTISKTVSGGTYDDQDTFLFEVYHNGTKITTVTLKAGQSITITGVTVGDSYTVKEIGGGSNRYTASASEITKIIAVDKANNNFNFTNTLSNNKWLTASDVKHNVFG